MPQEIVHAQVRGALQAALQEARRRGQLKAEPVPPLTLDPPKRPEWGDLASSVALTLAAAENRSPLDVAQIIMENMLQKEALFEKIEVARPGFLNMTVRRELWLKVLQEIEDQGLAFGKSDLGKGRKILVEFVSANPTGPLHVGHGRGAALGEAIAKLLDATGSEVVKEYYINDAGRQMKLLGASVWSRYQELHGREVPFPEEGYRGTYLQTVAALIRDRVGAKLLDLPGAEAKRECERLAYRELLDHIKNDLSLFGIGFDSWFSETALLEAGSVQTTLEDLKSRNLMFEQEGAWWFRSSEFGDEKDRVIRKQGGDYTYLASDIAYHRDKLLRGFDLLIDIWGADHHGYIPRMESVMQAYGHPKDRLRVVVVQMVNLLRGGRRVEMSKRTGEFITLREVMDEVGVDAAKFFFLMRRSDTHLDFDLELAKKQSAENPVYYVQYAHARVASLYRVAQERGVLIPRAGDTDLSVLNHPDELALIRKLSTFPSMLQASAAALEPHRITFYLQELAGLLHTFYFKHRILASAGEEAADAQSFVRESEPVPVEGREQPTPTQTAARLVLMRQVQQVIRNGLGILGVTAPDRM